VKVAAYQAPLAVSSCIEEMLALIREQVERCEYLGVDILCCPEGVLGGLADYSNRPASLAIPTDGGRLNDVLAPLTSETVTTIVGFTEIDGAGRLYNAAAVSRHGSVIGVYRKRHPAINRSVYNSGSETPVFTVEELTFGILICRDSTFPELARGLVLRGAAALFIPTNNGLPPSRFGPEVIEEARHDDIARATENDVAIIRADVAGQTAGLVAYGSSAIVGRDGAVLRSARRLEPELLIADIDVRQPAANRQIDVAPAEQPYEGHHGD